MFFQLCPDFTEETVSTLLDLLYNGEIKLGISLKGVLLKVQLTDLMHQLGINISVEQVNLQSTLTNNRLVQKKRAPPPSQDLLKISS